MKDPKYWKGGGTPFDENPDADLSEAIYIFVKNEVEISEYIRDHQFSRLENLISLEKLKLEYPFSYTRPDRGLYPYYCNDDNE